MFGCHQGKLVQVTVAGGSYQEGLTAVLQGVPPGLLLTEQEIYGDLLLRKPGTDELSSPRKEPDLPVIYTGVNAADTILATKVMDIVNLGSRSGNAAAEVFQVFKRCVEILFRLAKAVFY